MNQSNKNTQIKRSKRHMRYARGNTMNFLHTTMQQVGRAAVRFFAFALLTAMPMITAQAAVDIDQSPLILQKPLPPNIVLMLDDSGSMTWDYMPDFGYLKNNSNNDALINSANNSVYYDPTITYLPPLKADNTSYTNQTDFTNTPVDGFGTTSNDMIDLTNYNGYDDTGNINYSKSVLTNSSYTKTGISSSDCYSLYYNDQTAYDYSYSRARKSRPSSCTIYTQVSSGYFQYSTGPAAGPYTVHYVANTSCGTQSNCVVASDKSGVSAPIGVAAGNNIANWFAYYHTRILTTKTGLTLAFSGLDKTYRFGFASINGRNTADIPSPQYSFSTSNNSDNKLAEVQPFGDGSSGTQKAKFWTWITNISPNDGTPLRGALQAVGEYYKTQQPWETSSSDTSEYACRPSYTILTTDGFWNGDTPSGIGNADGQNGPKITTPSTYQYLKTAPYQDGYSDTLADVAMKYWETDLRTSVANEVPTTPSDPAFWQHMTTFTIGLGWDPTNLIRSTSGDANLTVPQILAWARSGNPPAGSSLTNSSNIWPKPTSNSINNIADLAHAAVNGHGEFYSVKSPDDLVNGLQSALKKIGESPGAGNAVTLSDTALPTDSTAADALYRFRGTFYTGQWSGTLTAENYTTTTTPPSYESFWSTKDLTPSFSTVGTGSSAERLSNRNVWTSTLGNGNKTSSVAFRVATDLSATQQTDLAATIGNSSVTAQTMVNYLLGDSTYAQGNPGGTLRNRDSFLGDIVSSTPVLIAAPQADLYAGTTFTGADTYSTFVNKEATRAPIVYVAANDGMLHAFRVTAGAGYERDGSTVSPVADQAKGTEVYAYMPSAVLTQTGDASITNLANPKYGDVDPVNGTQAVPHQYYNDGRITTQNVYFDKAWHTVLVGTTGRGPAKAIYALDITDPSVLMNPATADQALLWERSAGDGKTGSSYIGEMVGTPVIAQVDQGGQPSWAVFVGNGYNSAEGKPALLQFDLQTGDLSVHTTTGSVAADGGLAEPGLMQGDKTTGISTYAFAGDLQGHLWKFNLDSASSTGSVAFNAVDDKGNAQPITSLVTLAYDGVTNSTFALFGTGKYLASADTKDDQVQTWYGVRVGMGADLAGVASATTPVADSSTARSDLTERFAFDFASGDRATSAQTSDTDMNNKAGWFMDLPQTGERIVNRIQLISGKAVATTLIPKVNDPCNTVPAGAVMGVDPFTGANQLVSTGNGYNLGTKIITVDGKPQQVAINGKVFDAGPAAGVTAVRNADGTISITFNTLGGGLQSLGPLNLGGNQASRLSWRELTN